MARFHDGDLIKFSVFDYDILTENNFNLELTNAIVIIGYDDTNEHRIDSLKCYDDCFISWNYTQQKLRIYKMAYDGGTILMNEITDLGHEEVYIQGVVENATRYELINVIGIVDRYEAFIKFNGIFGGKLYRNGTEVQYQALVGTLSDEDIVFTAKNLSGFTFHNIQVKLKLNASYLGFGSSQLLDVPFFYDIENKTITIPFTYLFDADHDMLTLQVALKGGVDTNYYVYLNDKQIIIKDGFRISEELNEKLDSGFLQLTTEQGELDIEPFDNIVFDTSSKFTDFVRKHLLIDTYKANIDVFKPNLADSKFSYDINLFSETKVLERITLPNLSITSHSNGVLPTVWEKISEYCDMFLPKVRVYDANQKFVFRNCLYIDPAIEEKFADVDAPEKTWNEPTLREVLTDLMNVADCIPIVKDNVLTYFDLTLKGNPIDTTKLTNLEFEATSADYFDELTAPLQNIYKTGTTKMVEYVSPRSADNGGEISTDNMSIITSKPIYNIKSVILYKRIDFNANKLQRHDITNLIVEQDKWNTLDPNMGPTTGNIEDYQIYTIPYKRGQNSILNIGKLTQTRKVPTGYKNTEKIRLISLALGSAGVEAWKSSSSFGDTRNIFFKIEYETIDEATINVLKENRHRNKGNRVFDYTKDSAIDLNNYSIMEYMKANRLGNKITTIYGEYFSEDEIPQLADTLKNKVLFSRELTFYDDIIYFKGLLADDYIIKNYFTSVFSKKREWAIVGENETITRNVNIKLYASFGYCETNEITNENNFIGNPEVFRMQNINEVNNYYSLFYLYQAYLVSNAETAGYDVIVKSINAITRDKYGNTLPTSGDYVGIRLDFNVGVAGKSVIITTSFIDNYSAGFGAEKVDTGDGGYIWQNKPYRYADSDGETVWLGYQISSNMNNGDFDFDFESYLAACLASPDTNKLNAIENKVRQKPITKIWNYTVMPYFEIQVYKDNKEAIKSTIQIEHCNLTNDLEKAIGICYVKDAFSKATPLTTRDSRKKFYRCSSRYLESENELKPNSTLISGADFRAYGTPAKNLYLVDGNNAQVNISKNESIAITDNDDNLLFVMQLKEDFEANWWYVCLSLNFFYTDDLNIYNNVIDKIKIGDMSTPQYELDANKAQNESYVKVVKIFGREIKIYNQ